MSAYKTPPTKPTHKPNVAYVPVQYSKAKPQIDPARLSTAQRKTLWQGIQRDNPALADMLKNDENLALIKKEFDARIVFDLEEAISYAQQPLYTDNL